MSVNRRDLLKLFPVTAAGSMEGERSESGLPPRPNCNICWRAAS